MPTDWITVGGVITNIATALDLGYRYAPHEKIVGKSTSDILRDIDKILLSTSVLLENHKGLLPPEEYNELKGMYRHYHWQMTDESQQDRAATDDLIRQSRILSQLYAKRESHEDRAKTLLYKVEVYQSTVLAASRKAVPTQALAFADSSPSGNTSQTLASQPQHTTSNSYTSWFSAFGRSSRTSAIPTDIEAGSSQINSTAVAEGQGFIVAVTHFPRTSAKSIDVSTGEVQETVGTGSTVYRRMITFENDEKRISIIDRRLYALDKGETFISESSLRAMSELGENLLSQADSGVPKGSEVADHSDVLSLETTIQKFSKTSVA
ncbi:hypothetical protein BDV93DRAFT_525538 [Ceratobasidium sp. AG-I]|nr:hypothetical protein BDV93DRAFT_525538 [Ceratobasidium sp. AG-I]